MLNHNLYILERPSSWSTSRIHPSWPQSRVRLRPLLLSSMSLLLICLGPPSILLFTPMAHVSCSNPPSPTGQLHTNIQANNIAMLHHIYVHSHTYLHHIYITTHFFLHTSSTLLGRLIDPDPSCLSQDYLHCLLGGLLHKILLWSTRSNNIAVLNCLVSRSQLSQHIGCTISCQTILLLRIFPKFNYELDL